MGSRGLRPTQSPAESPCDTVEPRCLPAQPSALAERLRYALGHSRPINAAGDALARSASSRFPQAPLIAGVVELGLVRHDVRWNISRRAPRCVLWFTDSPDAPAELPLDKCLFDR